MDKHEERLSTLKFVFFRCCCLQRSGRPNSAVKIGVIAVLRKPAAARTSATGCAASWGRQSAACSPARRTVPSGYPRKLAMRPSEAGPMALRDQETHFLKQAAGQKDRGVRNLTDGAAIPAHTVSEIPPWAISGKPDGEPMSRLLRQG